MEEVTIPLLKPEVLRDNSVGLQGRRTCCPGYMGICRIRGGSYWFGCSGVLALKTICVPALITSRNMASLKCLREVDHPHMPTVYIPTYVHVPTRCTPAFPV